MNAPVIMVPADRNGPDGSGNGGYTSGLIAAHAGAGPVEVTLRRPPPLATPMSVVREAATTLVYADTTLIAEAVPLDSAADPLADPVPGASLDEATGASLSYPGFVDHPFPGCYVCGPRRATGDGLRIFPGPLPDGRTAAPWTAPAEVDAATVWAALDCPGGWAVLCAGRPYVLGRLAASVRAAPAPGQACVIVGRCDRVEGRKARIRTSLYNVDGALLAAARAIWISVDPSGVGGHTAG